jgi:hypothetical protein
MANEAILNSQLATPVLEHFTTFTHATVSVGTTIVLVPATTDVLANRKGIILQNKSSTALAYWGDSTVTAHADATVTGGYEIGPKDAIWIPLDGAKAIYVIADTAATGIFNLQVK